MIHNLTLINYKNMGNTEIVNIWTLLCQKAHIDSRTGLTTLVDVLEQINIDYKGKLVELEKPLAFPISSTLASFWKIPEKYKDKPIMLQVKVIDPKEEILGTSTLEFKTEKDYHKTFIDFPQMLITESGIYKFQLTIIQDKNKEVVKDFPITVNINEIEK